MRLIDADVLNDTIHELARADVLIDILSMRNIVNAQPTVCGTETKRNSSFHFTTDDFCEDCGEFTPDIDKEDVSNCYDIKRTLTVIRCEHREKCQRMCQWHEKKMSERRGV